MVDGSAVGFRPRSPPVRDGGRMRRGACLRRDVGVVGGQKRLQCAFVRRLGMQGDFYAHGLGSWISRAKRGDEKARRGWNMHRPRPGREASPMGIAEISSSRAAVNVSDVPDSEADGLPRRPERAPPCVPAARPGWLPCSVSRWISMARRMLRFSGRLDGSPVAPVPRESDSRIASSNFPALGCPTRPLGRSGSNISAATGLS